MEFKIEACVWNEISLLVEGYIAENNAVVDSYWEEHVLASNHYKITVDGEIIGFFAIHNNHTLTLFYMAPRHADKSQELFAKAKKYEEVTGAMVPTSDEFFLSHCLDDFARLEKQAYFAVYGDKGVAANRKKALDLRLVDIDIDAEILKQSGDFLDESIAQIRGKTRDVEIYIAQHNDEVVGFGVVDYGKIAKDVASIGMYVCEKHRKQGFAANILEHLKLMCFAKNMRAVSGCWYYNHNSKKSIEAAGAYSKTRLLRFCF